VLPIVARVADIPAPAGGVVEGHAACQAGEMAMGGGAYLVGEPGAGDQLLESGPVVVPASGQPAPPSGSEDPNGWFASAHNAGEARTLKVIAQCQR
jgi:hypothetical protein